MFVAGVCVYEMLALCCPVCLLLLVATLCITTPQPAGLSEGLQGPTQANSELKEKLPCEQQFVV